MTAAEAPDPTLQPRLDQYLSARRALGYHLDRLEYLAGGFCRWLDGQGKTTFTVEDAVAWARLPATADPLWWGIRLAAVRTFAAYLHATGMPVQIPPRGLLPTRPCRSSPFIYTQADIDALLAACPAAFPHELIAASMQTVVGLLAATGLRIGEALRLTPADIDPARSVLVIENSKHTTRLVPVHPTTVEHLQGYQQLPARRRCRPDPQGPLLVSTRGTGYHRSTIESYFQRLVTAAGLEPHGRARPVLHSLRHTFATAHMAAAYQTGADPMRTLTLLATWLGHTSPAHTYWYLTATPELMALAAGRLELSDPIL